MLTESEYHEFDVISTIIGNLTGRNLYQLKYLDQQSTPTCGSTSLEVLINKRYWALTKKAYEDVTNNRK